MGNVLFRCRSASTMKAVRVNQRRRSSWQRMLSTCGAPSEESIPSISEKQSSNHRTSAKYDSWSRSTSKASISSPHENSRESLLHPKREGPSVYSPTSFYSPLNSSPPNMTRTSFNQYCSEKQHVHSPTSRSSPMSDSSPDIASPTSGSSPIVYSSPDMTRESFNQYCYEQGKAHSPTSHSSPISTGSQDLTRMHFNQHCRRQLHLPSSKKYSRSPRRHNKQGWGKSTRRKRSGMRSPSHRTSNCKSSGRALNGRIEDNEDKIFEMRSQSHRTSKTKSLGTILNYGCSEGNEDKHSAPCSPPYRTSYSAAAAGRTANGHIKDIGNSGPRYTSSYDSQAAVGRVISSPISRRQALALIGRQKLLASRKYPMGFSEHCRRHWKPALESISEAVCWGTF